MSTPHYRHYCWEAGPEELCYPEQRLKYVGELIQQKAIMEGPQAQRQGCPGKSLPPSNSQFFMHQIQASLAVAIG